MLANLLVAFVAILPALAASLPSITPTANGRSCGTYISDERIVEAEKHFEANKVVSNSSTERAPLEISVRVDYLSLAS